jgi:hypothetical protein
LEKGSGNGPPRRRPTQHQYGIPQLWCDYDRHKRQFVRQPTLPASALPSKTKEPPAKGPKLAAHTEPASGADLRRRLAEYDARLAAQGVCRSGDLLAHVVQARARAGHPTDLSAWNGPAIQLALEAKKAFGASHRPPPKEEVA